MTDSIETIVGRESGLHRGLTSRKIAMIAIGGAIGTGLFLGSGFAISTAGPSVLISYAIGALIALLLMGCLAEMSIAHPTTGSFGTYAEQYLGPLAGYLVRNLYWMSVVLGVGTEITAVALYMKFWFPAQPGWLWIVLFSGTLIGINASSVKSFGSVEYGFSFIKVTAIVGFIVVAGYVVLMAPSDPLQATSSVGFHNYSASGGFFPHGFSGTWVATIMAVFSYLSIEMIAVAAGEAAEPRVAIMRAFRSTVFRLVLFYVLTLALMLAVVPWTQAGSSESPFVTVMRTLGIPAAAGIMNFVVLIAALSAMNSQLYVTTRMLFSMSRAGYVPRSLGTLNARGIPLGALLVSSSGIAVAALLNVMWPAEAFIPMVAVSCFGALFAWMMIFVTHYAFRRQRSREANAASRFRVWGFPFTTLLGAGLMFALLVTTPFTSAFRLTLLVGLPVLAGLTLLYRLQQRSTRSRDSTAGGVGPGGLDS
ncbi:MAG TPA: amino acid permease [Steroidobacteraceae bacterium]|nr:amino acid permease [Steroidobacteraceae bacterium]